MTQIKRGGGGGAENTFSLQLHNFHKSGPGRGAETPSSSPPQVLLTTESKSDKHCNTSFEKNLFFLRGRVS